MGKATGRYVSPQLVQIIKRTALKIVAATARAARTTLIDTSAELSMYSQCALGISHFNCGIDLAPAGRKAGPLTRTETYVKRLYRRRTLPDDQLIVLYRS